MGDGESRKGADHDDGAVVAGDTEALEKALSLVAPLAQGFRSVRVCHSGRAVPGIRRVGGRAGKGMARRDGITRPRHPNLAMAALEGQSAFPRGRPLSTCEHLTVRMRTYQLATMRSG